MKRAIGYLRVSTGLQAEHGLGLEVQRDRVREYALVKGLELIDMVREAASGGVQNGEEFSWEHRPILLDVLARAEAGDFDVLLVAQLDRLSRDYATLAVLERRLQRYGVEVVSTSEENGDGPIAEYLRGNLALIAQLERAMIRDRLDSGKAAGKRLGRHVHGQIPYGYTSDRGRLEPDPELVPVVRRIFADAKAGDSPGRIARALNRELLPSPGGAEWGRMAVRRILQNEAYAGELYRIKKAHPAIVTRQLWNAANETLRKRARNREKPQRDHQGE